jgi:hypothetical protein
LSQVKKLLTQHPDQNPEKNSEKNFEKNIEKNPIKNLTILDNLSFVHHDCINLSLKKTPLKNIENCISQR